MAKAPSSSLVVPSQFIQAIRDSGYKTLGSAVAELIDNAFEANATKVLLTIQKNNPNEPTSTQLTICDNGKGMDADTISHALQFGWSSHFNQRNSFGRYGMGLPNASLSHARRVEVWSSVDGRKFHAVHLDVDEVVNGNAPSIGSAAHIRASDFRKCCPFTHGTAVRWKNCDRLNDKRIESVVRRLRSELGCLFRYQLWAGKTISVNGERVLPFDPMFLREGTNLKGAKPHGGDLAYPVAVPGQPNRTSTITVRFSVLPVPEWHSLSNEEKNASLIAKRAGVSIVRAGREIDRGWFFMGQKRRENYDDWWRCEVLFDPDLDELFGVTHTKQEIRPTEQLIAILTPDMERIARDLNSGARKAFMSVKSERVARRSEKIAERLDNLIEPPKAATKAPPNKLPQTRADRGRVAGLEYRLQANQSESDWFFQPELNGPRLTVTVNERHPFFQKSHWGQTGNLNNGLQDVLELLILAAARAEITLAKNRTTRLRTQHFRETWSNILATFLS